MRYDLFRSKFRFLVLAGTLTLMVTSCASSKSDPLPLDAQNPNEVDLKQENLEEEGVSYDVQTEDVEHGKIEVSKESAKTGDSITATFMPDKGYSLVQTVINDVYSTTQYEKGTTCYEEFDQIEGGSSVSATFEANDYKVTLVDRYFGKSFSDVHVTYDDVLRLPTSHVDVIGYSLSWYDLQGNLYSDGQTWETDCDVTLYASYVSNTYKVTLDANGGSFANEASSMQVDVTFNSRWSFEKPTRFGYYFGGWYISELFVPSSGNEWSYSTSDVILVAKWNADTYDVTFDLAGGNGTTSTQVSYKEEYSFDVPTREGYSFRGWYLGNESVELSGTWDYSSEDVTLTAKWQADDFILTLNLDGGNGAGSYEVSYGSLYSIPRPSKVGYDFGGWLLDDSIVPESAEEWTYSKKNVTLKANWIARSLGITLDLNGGMGTKSDVVTYGESYSLPTPSRAGYSFLGWYLGDDRIDTEGESWTFSSKNVTLAAKWQKVMYSITLDLDGGVGKKSADVTYGDSYDLGTPTKAGYTFDGWYYGDNRKVETEDDSWVYANGITLKAKWKANSYTANFVGNGGFFKDSLLETYTSTLQSFLFQYGDTKVLTPKRDGYTFAGYYTAASGGKLASIGDSDETECSSVKYNFAYNKTLYAHWTANVYNVVFDLQGGKNVTWEKNTNLTYDTTYTYVVERDGYTFAGWYTEANGNGTRISEVEESKKFTFKWTFLDVTKLYANWIANTYTVQFHLQSGTKKWTTTTKPTLTYDVAYIYTAERDGYNFIGWYTKENGGGTCISDKEDGSFTWKWTNVTDVYAYWQQKGSTISVKIETVQKGISGGYIQSTWISDQTGTFESSSEVSGTYTYTKVTSTTLIISIGFEKTYHYQYGYKASANNSKVTVGTVNTSTSYGNFNSTIDNSSLTDLDIIITITVYKTS